METTLTEPYLKTRLIHPQVRSQRVPRQRLLHRMEEAWRVPLTLVCAPAGYGKTTLLVDWTHANPVPVAWLTLSPEENDAVRFLNYLILALQTLEPELGKAAQAALNLPAAEMLESSLHLLVNDLANLTNSLALVLDDYHWIEMPAIHAALEHLVEHLPPSLHLVIASRAEPPLHLTRLRARAVVLELRAADLSFQPDEIASFLNEVMALGLPLEECQRLGEQTEGWPAALQLAALSLRSGERPAGPAVFSAGQHYIFEYLAEEVLHQQPPALQRFLLHTCILEQLTGPLCDVLVEPFLLEKSGAECLDYLEHASLFTQALDSEHRWYRYHALFADFLRQQLQCQFPDRVPVLHRQAATWLAGHGAPGDAFRHALAGNDQEQAASLVEACAETLQQRGELTTLERWVTALPEALVLSRPRLNLARAWIALSNLNLAQAGAYLDQTEQACEALVSRGVQTGSLVYGEILAARTLLTGMLGRVDEAQACAQQAMRLLPGEQHYLAGLLKFNISLPLLLAGRVPQAVHALEEAVALAQLSHTPFVALLSLRMLGEAYLLAGRLGRAEHAFRQIGELVEREWGPGTLMAGLAWLGLGEIARQHNDFARASQYLNEGIETTLTWMPALAMDGFMWQAWLKQASGDAAGAQAVTQRAHLVSETHSQDILDDWWLPITSVRLSITQGYLEDALRWARSTGLDLENLGNLEQYLLEPPIYFRESVLYTLVRLFLVLGRREKTPRALEKAQKILACLVPMNEELGQYAMLLEGLLLAAQVEQALDQPHAAQDFLHRALDLGAPERPLRVFLDEGPSLMTLLSERRSLELPPFERAYLEEILDAWNAETQPVTAASRRPAGPPGLVEPLSFRELEVLRWLAEGKSNQQIAAGLVLSLNTVKKHVSTIMDKLGASNRTQAVQIARQIGILDT